MLRLVTWNPSLGIGWRVHGDTSKKTAECVVNEIEIQSSYLGFEFERVMGG